MRNGSRTKSENGPKPLNRYCKSLPVFSTQKISYSNGFTGALYKYIFKEQKLMFTETIPEPKNL